MATYAWFVLSRDPVVSGIQVTVGGGNTIMIAPDLTQMVDGKICHYPGAFSDRMQMNRQESYRFLQSLGGLTPVSTADGESWFLPAYYGAGDPEVLSGEAMIGQLKPVEDFMRDYDLSHANLPASDEEALVEGSYFYLDFWVVSNGGDLTLRISSGEDGVGSYVMDLPTPVAGETVTGYTLATPEQQAAAAVRVGFLANELGAENESMLCYQNSAAYDSRYMALRGFYREPHSGEWSLSENRFSIYEPNCDLHPSGASEKGSYMLTNPLGMVDGKIAPVSVGQRITAQKAGNWKAAENGNGTALAQHFQAALIGKAKPNTDKATLNNTFYESYLQGQLSPYVHAGRFIRRSQDLYKFSESLTARELDTLDDAGATDDVFIVRLAKHIPQRIRMFIWLEGQDVDCVNSAAASSFAVNIELAGGSE
jgi:hypothetical protein